ncbi:hypothetical protein [Pseudomonas canadensis]|uniref:hypothetical protein n=1 Tax=Pseudomonas canadensis TaxID=915099 RepID=UPI003BA28E9E
MDAKEESILMPVNRNSLLRDNGRKITLPNAGQDDHADLDLLVEYWVRNETSVIKTGPQTAASGEFYSGDDSLDAMLRICCLPKESCFREAIQINGGVIEAFLETGLFTKEGDVDASGFTTLRFDLEKGKKFRAGKADLANPIHYPFFAKSPFNSRV